ncbi:CAAX prenyl protease, partial [Elasticomyces elasticus]
MAPAGYLDRGTELFKKLKSYYTQDTPHKPPPISHTTAAALLVFYTILYIAPFYLSPTLRATSSASRDSPAVIKARARAVLLVSLAVTAITTSVLVFRGNATPREIVRLFGLWPAQGFPVRAFVSDTAKGVLLVCVNFLGPLYEWAVAEG